jgi:hypothetical protein
VTDANNISHFGVGNKKNTFRDRFVGVDLIEYKQLKFDISAPSLGHIGRLDSLQIN